MNKVMIDREKWEELKKVYEKYSEGDFIAVHYPTTCNDIMRELWQAIKQAVEEKACE